MTGDLLSLLNPPCGQCSWLGDAIESDIRYCRARLVWQWATTRTDCSRRGVKLPPQPDEAREGSQDQAADDASGIDQNHIVDADEKVAPDFFAENANNSTTEERRP